MSVEPIGRASLRLTPSEQRLLLILGDLMMALLALALALYLWSVDDDWIGVSMEFLVQRVPFWFYILPFGWLVVMVEMYDVHRSANWQKTLRGVALAAVVALIIYALIYFTSTPNSLPRRGVTMFFVSVPALTLLWRVGYIRLYTSAGLMRRYLIVGAGDTGRTLAEVYAALNPAPFTLVGFIDDDLQKVGTEVAGFPVVGNSAALLDLIDAYDISDVVVAIAGEMRGDTFQKLLDAQERGLEISRMPRVYEDLLGRVPVRHLESDWVIRSFVDEARASGFYELLKRALDIFGALVGLGILAMLMPVIALVTVIDSGFPIFYKQERLGQGGRPHWIYKFRTMRQDAEKDGKARPAAENDPRITRVGNFLRRTRIDELPQFWNVLRGEMSLIGPRSERPQLVEEYQKQIPFYRARLLVKPGISGWAQVNFGYASTIDDTVTKLEYDLYYIKHRSIALDILIILRTIGTVFGLRGR
jgi:exopolysaccharide biosynthesis polyprenyl glycosylphosphotransferase